jgi:hypothetical protein
MELLFCGVAFVMGCMPWTARTRQVSVETEVASHPPASCDSLLGLPVIARAAWDKSGTELLVVGGRVGEGESDRRFEVIDAQLLLVAMKGPSLLAQAPLGELTRVVPETDQLTPPEVLEISVRPLGEMESFDHAVALERASIADVGTVLLVHLMRDVRWGLTERYAVLVTMRGETMVAGDRVLVGRDSLEEPMFFGTFEIGETERAGKLELVLTREGMGVFSKRIVFALDDTGAVRAVEKSDE